jgi:MYXO-CTERM domain-containing protein
MLSRWNLVVSCFALAGLGVAAPASADLGACDDILIEARAECKVVPPSLECEKQCTPLSIKAVCSARLAAMCDASCDELPSVDCSAQCVAGCTGDCTVDPGKFDCRAACEADCSGSCEAGCRSSDDRTQCSAECMGSCSVSCQKSCDVRLPSASCDAKCMASCEGSCRVETNLDCQVDCQADGYASCEAEVKGGCEIDCKGDEGALFCDGQYIDHGDNLQMCVDALKARLDVRVTAESSGSSGCDGGTCTAEGRAKVSSDCSVARAGGTGGSSLAWMSLAALAAIGWRRRRTR